MNEEIQALDLGTAEVAVITPKIISDVIEEIRRDTRVWAQFYKVNRDLTGEKGGKEVEFPKKESGITATFDVAAGTGISTSDIAYSAVTIKVKKGGLGLAFQNESIKQANRDVVADCIKEAGEVWADTLDIVAMEEMFPTVDVTVSTTPTATSFAVGVKVWHANADSIITLANTGSTIVASGDATVTIWYAPTTRAEGDTIGSRRVTGTANSFCAKDILNVRADLLGEKFTPNVVMMHTDLLTDILYDPQVKFLEKSVYKGEGELYNAELGRIWDLRVIVSNKCPKYGIVLIDTKSLGYEVQRTPLKLKRDEYTGASTDVLYFWGFGEINYGVVNAQAYGVVAKMGTYAPTAN